MSATQYDRSLRVGGPERPLQSPTKTSTSSPSRRKTVSKPPREIGLRQMLPMQTNRTRTMRLNSRGPQRVLQATDLPRRTPPLGRGWLPRRGMRARAHRGEDRVVVFEHRNDVRLRDPTREKVLGQLPGESHQRHPARPARHEAPVREETQEKSEGGRAEEVEEGDWYLPGRVLCRQ